jgi:hypothetical protein
MEVNPNFVAFRETAAFPAGDVGPVERRELATQAACLAAEMGRFGLFVFGSGREGSGFTTTMGWARSCGLAAAPPPLGWAAFANSATFYPSCPGGVGVLGSRKL